MSRLVDPSTLQALLGAPARFDPATLNLTGWWRGDYASSPWTGTASAGPSGGRTMTTLVSAPSTGLTDQNAHVPAKFVAASTQALQDPSFNGSYFWDSVSYSYVVYVMPSAPAAPAANIYDNPQIVAMSGDTAGLAYHTSGVQAWHYDGAFTATASVAISADAWHSIAVTFSQGVLSLSVDGGAPVTVAKNTIPPGTLASASLRFGRANVTPYATMSLQEVIVSKTVFSSATLTSIRDYFARRYAPTSIKHLNLSGWWRSEYKAATWYGVDSAGSSAGRTMGAGVLPSAGTAVNGRVPADFNGSTQWLLGSVNADSFLSNQGGFLAALFIADTSVAPAANAYDDPAIFSDNAGPRFQLCFTSSGIRGTVYNGAAWVITPSIACATGAYHWAFMWWDSTNLFVQLDGGASQSVSIGGTVSLLATPMTMGRNAGAVKWLDGRIVDAMSAPGDLHSFISLIKTYGNARYALSL